MKQSLLALSLVLASSLAHADLAEKFQENCNASEVMALKGAAGSCRIVVAPKKIQKQGACVGTFMGSLPCVVSYIAVKEGAAMNLTCGTDMNAPAINQDMGAEAVGFNVATMIKKTNGQDIILNDNNEYSQFANEMVEVMITESTAAGVTTSAGEISISLQGRQIPLTNVRCQ